MFCHILGVWKLIFWFVILFITNFRIFAKTPRESRLQNSKELVFSFSKRVGRASNSSWALRYLILKIGIWENPGNPPVPRQFLDKNIRKSVSESRKNPRNNRKHIFECVYDVSYALRSLWHYILKNENFWFFQVLTHFCIGFLMGVPDFHQVILMSPFCALSPAK